MPAVAYGVEDSHKDIVHYGEQGTVEIETEIGNGLGHYLCRGAHPAQNRGSKGHAQNRQRNAGGEAEGDVRVNRPAHGGIVPGTVVPGDDDAGTHCHAVEESHHHEDQASGGTDRRQGVVSQKVPHDKRVKGVIELLKNIAQKHRERKEENLFPDASFCQIVAADIHAEYTSFHGFAASAAYV